jgi:general secretion pathway protein I
MSLPNASALLRKRASGFTLLEVLAALVIVALGMLGVIEAVSQTARNSSYVREKTIAHWIAMNQLTLARLTPQAPKVDKSSDEIEMGNRRWRWTMEVTQTPVESVRRIDVRVRPEDSEEGSSLASVIRWISPAAVRMATIRTKTARTIGRSPIRPNPRIRRWKIHHPRKAANDACLASCFVRNVCELQVAWIHVAGNSGGDRDLCNRRHDGNARL